VTRSLRNTGSPSASPLELESRTIVWRARWDKTGREWRQPLIEAAAGALGIAWVWRERAAYSGPWVFYSSHARKRAMGDDSRAVYHPMALLRALCLAETPAGVTHRPPGACTASGARWLAT
jgi:hypothetical protein